MLTGGRLFVSPVKSHEETSGYVPLSCSSEGQAATHHSQLLGNNWLDLEWFLSFTSHAFLEKIVDTRQMFRNDWSRNPGVLSHSEISLSENSSCNPLLHRLLAILACSACGIEIMQEMRRELRGANQAGRGFKENMHSLGTESADRKFDLRPFLITLMFYFEY